MANTKAAKSEFPVEIPEVNTKEQTKGSGNYLCLTTKNIKGMRINLDTLESYGPSGDTTINLSRSSGKITVEFDTRAERDELLARIDSYCL